MKKWQFVTIIIFIFIGFCIGVMIGYGRILPGNCYDDLCRTMQQHILDKSISKGALYGSIAGFIIGGIVVLVTQLSILKKIRQRI